jgi:hypothetical protein
VSWRVVCSQLHAAPSSRTVRAAGLFFADQGPLFSRKQWVPVRFCRSDLLRHTLSTTVLRAAHRPAEWRAPA